MKAVFTFLALIVANAACAVTPAVVEALKVKAAVLLHNSEFQWNILAERSSEGVPPKISDLVGPRMPMEAAKESYRRADPKDLPYDAAIGFTCDISTGNSSHDNLLAIFYYPSTAEESTLYLFPIRKSKEGYALDVPIEIPGQERSPLYRWRPVSNSH